ncbi:hypothetical protein OAD42_05050 [Oceanospirillaceae bacterium]|nr:hypothetical protein [Oceanospirillaceae bacterium]
MFYAMGAFFGYVLLTLLVRETIYAKNESAYAETYSGILVAILGAGVNGFGNADGGVFNISMVLQTFILYLGFVLLTFGYNWLKRTKYEYVPQSKLERYIYWPVFILLLLSTVSLTWLVISTNDRLFDYKEGYKLETVFGDFLLISPDKRHVIDTLLIPMELELPIQVDGATVLAQLEYDEYASLISYQYVLVDVNLLESQLAPFAATILERTCSDETMNDYWFFKAGLSVTHQYYDAAAQRATIKLNPDLCSQQSSGLNMLPYIELVYIKED